MNYDLFRKNCVPSPMCACGVSKETVDHFLLYCERYAASRDTLFASQFAQLIGKSWHNSSNRTKLNWMLNGIPFLFVPR